MKIRFAIVSFLLLYGASGCEVVTPDYERFVPRGDIAALVIRTNRVSSSFTEIVYDTELQFMFKFFHVDNSSVLASDFVLDQYTSILDVDPVYYSGTKQSDVIFLIDQSRSYEITDPHNSRSQLISKFAEEFSGYDFAIAGFSKDGMQEEAIEFIEPFGNRDQYVKSIFDLAKKTGGVSNLYDAIDVALTTFSPNSTRQKQIVALVQGNDQGSSKSLDAVVNSAVSQNVRIHVVALGPDVSHNSMAQLSQQTGGFYAACETDKQMIQVLDNLNRNITGNSIGIKVRVKVTPPGGVTPGSSFLHSLVAEDYLYEYNYNTVYPFVKIP